ncbi:MAG: PTPA-CTERM sorting domain-containing protein [Leptolyngbya sp. BL-A-14]
MSQIFLQRSFFAAIGVVCFTVAFEQTKPAIAANFTAIDFSAPTTNFTNGQWSLGFQFTTNKTINVTSLGFYDDFQNDLTQNHDIGIFDKTGTLLVQGTVKPGDALDGFFRYTSVQSTQLQAGGTFFIASTTGTENYTFNPTGFSVNPNITFVSSVFRFSDTLVFPIETPAAQSSDGNKGYFGPNFKADAPAAIPTPALLPGLIGLGIGAWRKHKKAIAKQTNNL